MATKQRREGILKVVVGNPSQNERDQTDPTAFADVNACKANEPSSLTHCQKCPWVRENKLLHSISPLTLWSIQVTGLWAVLIVF